MTWYCNADTVAKYTYDPWGKVLSVTNASGVAQASSSFIGNINPIRYRGYYYDTDLGLYYLQSRYYDPETGRFVNGDAYDALNQDHTNLAQYNLYVYCFDDPINYTDGNGNFAIVDDAVYLIIGLIAIGVIAITYVSTTPEAQLGWSGFAQSITDSFANIWDKDLPDHIVLEHRTLKNGSKSRLNDKHTKPRPGRQSEKKKQKDTWKPRNGAIIPPGMGGTYWTDAFGNEMYTIDSRVYVVSGNMILGQVFE